MKTECIAYVNLIDLTAKSDSTLTSLFNSSFADISLLKKDNQNREENMTLEWNYSLLDGEMEHFSTLSCCEFPYYSNVQSNISGQFLKEPSINISFEEKHSSLGISLLFSGDYPKKIKVEWYNNRNILLDGVVFYPDKNDYFCSHKVSNYTNIKIYILETVFPHRNAKLENIEYGCELAWGGERVVKGEITEEFNAISSEIAINTCSLTILDEDRAFNLLNPRDLYSIIQPMQTIKLQERREDTLYDMGTFYLNEWSSKSDNTISFEAVNAIGIISKTDFKKGKIYDNEKASNIIDEIMKSAGWENYEVTEAVASTLLSGYLEVCSHREALQQVLFAARAVLSCSRSNKIRIYRLSRDIPSKVSNDRIFLGENLKLTQYISDIQIAMRSYELQSGVTKVFDGSLKMGLNEITLSNPATELSIDSGNAEIIERGVNYCIVKMRAAGECQISGRTYKALTSLYTQSVSEVAAGEVKKTLKVNSATLVSKDNVMLVAAHILEYYELRKEIERKFLSEGELTGEWINIESQSGVYVSGIVEKQNIDLTGGFISTVTAKGYSSAGEDYVYTKEIYTGEKIGVI